MGIDVLILNTAVVDLRGDEFAFAEKLAGAGGLAKCHASHMPAYTQAQYHAWLDSHKGTAGGPGNTAPLIARLGVKTAVAANLGRGEFDGLDAQGRFFHDTMTANQVDMSETYRHPTLPTGITFIYEKGNKERGGLTYFPNANDDFDFEHFKGAVTRLKPAIVYYMYSGLSERGDARGGRDLADFMRWCHRQGFVTIVDSHTLTADPQALIQSGAKVPEYHLLDPLLPELDLFFTSSDEARMIENTLHRPRPWDQVDETEAIPQFLDFVTDRFCAESGRCQLFGVTVSDGAWYKAVLPDGEARGPEKVTSRFMAGDVVDLVGAGDSFRAGLISYVAKNIDAFRRGAFHFDEAIQMGNLFASLYIKAPLDHRYEPFTNYEDLLAKLKDALS